MPNCTSSCRKRLCSRHYSRFRKKRVAAFQFLPLTPLKGTWVFPDILKRRGTLILSLTRFFQVISQFFPGTNFTGKDALLSKLNPDKIYVENVRSVLGVSHGEAV